MQSMTIDSAAIRLTDTILGQDEPDLEQALKAIAANVEVLHIAVMNAYVRRKARTRGPR